MKSSFNLTFVKIRTCESREQCMKPTEKRQMQGVSFFSAIQTQFLVKDSMLPPFFGRLYHHLTNNLIKILIYKNNIH